MNRGSSLMNDSNDSLYRPEMPPKFRRPSGTPSSMREREENRADSADGLSLQQSVAQRSPGFVRFIGWYNRRVLQTPVGSTLYDVRWRVLNLNGTGFISRGYRPGGAPQPRPGASLRAKSAPACASQEGHHYPWLDAHAIRHANRKLEYSFRWARCERF